MRCYFNLLPWVEKIPWRREWQPTPLFFPGESHGQRNLAGYSPWDRKESDMAEHVHMYAFFYALVTIDWFQIGKGVRQG